MGGEGINNKTYVDIMDRMILGKGSDVAEKKFFGYFG